ncbi:MAG: maltose ABC transporter permease [Chloroflexi bacterium]|nr:MAG: maltose ABC transporter permease [Chloroflexota bacterium]
MFLALVLFWLLGPLAIDTAKANPLSAPPDMPPSREFPLGTDSTGRQLLPVLLQGTLYTLQIGLIAGSVGLLIGIILGFAAGYFGGPLDTVIRTSADVILTIPTLAVLVVIASLIKERLTPQSMAQVIALLAWMWPTRTIRAQVLTLRERPYVEIARLSGLGDSKIIIQELFPNLLPYLAASFVGAVSAAILAAVGLEALGLGPQHDPTLGMTIFWGIYYGAILRGMWWWWLPPIAAIAYVFIGLFLISWGLDELANPRLRRAG